MLRGRPSALALTSVGLVVAAFVGVQLGQSAISEINPIHFQGALERPQGITPPPERAPYDPYARDYVWSLPPDPTLARCIGDCDQLLAGQAASYAMADSAGREPLPYWRDATPTTELRPWPPGDMPNGSLRMERYMSYPVNREQAEQAERAAADAARKLPPAQAQTVAATPAEALRVPAAAPEPVVVEE